MAGHCDVEDGVYGHQGDLSLYNTGSIVRFDAKDFMTYSRMTVYPGPFLNVIIGPNGTGKSSFVCALCMGLGGKPSLLGRGDSPKEFIRRGCTSCWVEIELKAEPRNYIVRRELKLVDDQVENKYKINNQVKTLKDVNNLMDQLNIQLGNLCQFLPQDKVVEFAKLNPMELLVETEKALGDAKLYNQHQELVELRKKFKEHEEARNGMDQSLQSKLQAQQKQQADFDRYTEKEALENEAKEDRQKILWLDVREQQRLTTELEHSFKVAERELTEAKRTAAGDDRPVRALKDKEAAAQEQVKQQQAMTRRIETALHNVQQEINKLHVEFNDSLVPELGGLQAASDRRKAAIQEKEAALRKAQQDLHDHPPVPQETLDQIAALEAQYQEARAQVAGYDQTAQALQHNIRIVQDNKIKTQERMRRLEDIKMVRLQHLERQQFHGIRDAYQWVRQKQHEGAFKDQVFGPIALEVEVQNPLWAQYLENEVSLNRWAQFVALNREDETLLTNHFRSQGWKVPTGSWNEPWDYPLHHPQGEASRFANLGVTHTMDQIYEAHPAIKHIMNLGWVYVGGGQADVDSLKQSGIRKVYTPNLKVQITSSRYNPSAVSTAESQLYPCKMLTGNSNSAQLENLKQELSNWEQENEKIQQELDKVTALWTGAKAQMDGFWQQKEALEVFKTRSFSRKHALNQVVQAAGMAWRRAKDTPEPLDREPVIRAAMQRNVEKMFDASMKGTGLMEQLVKATFQLSALELQKKELHMQWQAASAEREQRKSQLEQLEAAFRDRQKDYQGAAALLAQLVAEAKRADPEAKGKKLLKDECDAAAQQGLDPPTREILQDRAEEKETRAAAIHINNYAVAIEYRDRQEQINNLRKTLETRNMELGAVEHKMDKIKGEWEPKLKELIQTVNRSFSENFRQIGCAGEVVLVEEADYDKYRVEVRVKFREEEDLQVLTAHRQSGGERSVSTILYLIALQGVTQTPFRVVDEINQGMDPVNERKVFDQLVAAASRDKTPQCFLLTPKLLPGLEYGERATILCIFNGTQVEQAVAENMSKESMFGTRILNVRPNLMAVG